MRKKKRYITKGAIGGAFFFILIDGISQYRELKEEGKPFLENMDFDRSVKKGTAGFFIGGGLGYLLYKLQQWEERDLSFCPDNHLHKVLNTFNAKSDPSFVSKAKKITNNLKEKLSFEFGDELIDKPQDFGSAKTKTAIGGSSDFDILVPFKKRAGKMIELYDYVHELIDRNYSHKYFEIRKQRHSVGLTYDDGDLCIHTDIVPARERNDYHTTGDVTILRRGKGLFETHKYIKSNIRKKRDIVVNQPEARRIIKLMKIYRGESNVTLNSPAVVVLVKEAMLRNKGYINSSIFNNWTLAMAYVADQLQTRVKIKDVANTNNNLLEKMSEKQRNTIMNLIYSDLEHLEKSPKYLKEIFEIE